MTSWYQQPMIAYDHSQLAQIALQIFLGMKRKFSKSHVIHVFNSNKNGYVLHTINTNTIEQHLKYKFPAQNKDNTTIQLREQGSKSVNEIILESFISSGTNLLFLGFVGTKGKKPRSSDFSSRVSQFVYESKISLAIIKRQSSQTGNLLFCFDGSQIAVAGLMKANEFCLTFGKTLTVVHCTTSQLKTHTKHIKNQVKTLKQQTKDLKFEFIVQEQLDLIDWIKQSQNDLQWVIITSNGYRGEISKMRFVGQTATRVLEEVNANIFLLKG